MWTYEFFDLVEYWFAFDWLNAQVQGSVKTEHQKSPRWSSPKRLFHFFRASLYRKNLHVKKLFSKQGEILSENLLLFWFQLVKLEASKACCCGFESRWRYFFHVQNLALFILCIFPKVVESFISIKISKSIH